MAHIHDAIDFTVSAFIVHNEKVLLILHKQLKRWLPVGGHVELDEDPEQALFREIREECGLEVEVLAEKPDLTSSGTKFLYRPAFLDIHDIGEAHKHVGMIYVATAKTDAVTLAESEHDNIRWFSPDELGQAVYDLSPAIQFYCREALKLAEESAH